DAIAPETVDARILVLQKAQQIRRRNVGELVLDRRAEELAQLVRLGGWDGGRRRRRARAAQRPVAAEKDRSPVGVPHPNQLVGGSQVDAAAGDSAEAQCLRGVLADNG